jgi:hypothetical protein
LAGGAAVVEGPAVVDCVVEVAEVVEVGSVVVDVVVDEVLVAGPVLLPPPINWDTPYAIRASRIRTSTAQPMSATGLRYHGRGSALGSSASKGANWSGAPCTDG